ncbi:MAG: HPr kinase/phosphatase C-terminal domain-containing protein, partial [Alphaproteobacteria bacterium]
MTVIHGTCVAIDDVGLLLRGPPRSGKSDLALRLIDGGARLVADDRVVLEARDGNLIASAPAPIAGLIEVHGLGIARLDESAEARLGLAVELVPPEQVERLPEPESCTYEGISLPLIRLAPFEASAPAKLRLAARTCREERRGRGGRFAVGAL